MTARSSYAGRTSSPVLWGVECSAVLGGDYPAFSNQDRHPELRGRVETYELRPQAKPVSGRGGGNKYCTWYHFVRVGIDTH